MTRHRAPSGNEPNGNEPGVRRRGAPPSFPPGKDLVAGHVEDSQQGSASNAMGAGSGSSG